MGVGGRGRWGGVEFTAMIASKTSFLLEFIFLNCWTPSPHSDSTCLCIDLEIRWYVKLAFFKASNHLVYLYFTIYVSVLPTGDLEQYERL